MKGTIQRNLLRVDIGKVLLSIDWELHEDTATITLSNPRVDIPAANVKGFDAREHKAFRGEVNDPSVQNEFRTLLARQIGPIVSEMKIDMKELLA